MQEKRHVLVADDSEAVRRLIAALLKPMDVKITEAGDGFEAVALANGQPFDLIVTDYEMPGLDGMALCRRLKSVPRTKAIPIIMVSSFDAAEEVDRAFESGAAAFISKQDVKSNLLPECQRILSKTDFKQTLTVLVVDDSASVISMVTDGLTQAGFRVLTAGNGVQALEILAQTRPDLILSDIDMPQMDGFALCDAVHLNSDYCAIPFVVMSSHGDRASMHRMIQRGAASYIVKPFNIHQLVLLIEKLLSDQFQIMLKEKDRLESEHRLLVATISSLVTALEARDAYTRGHSENVAEITAALAAFSGASSSEVAMVRMGGQLHDIGKIGIPDRVLLKPGNLDDDEYELIKQHPLMGAIILKPIGSLDVVADMTLSHHERVDGKGYPHGLKGDKLSPWVRMLSVADTYDAITSDRPYRKGKPDDQAFEILKSAKGTQLCPDSVELFLQWVWKGRPPAPVPTTQEPLD